MGGKQEVWQGTLSLMVLRTLASMGPQHGFGIGRRIEDVSGQRLKLNYGTLYPMLVKLEQEGLIASEWRQSENNRRAKYYALTPAGRRALAKQAREWRQTADLMSIFLSPELEIP